MQITPYLESRAALLPYLNTQLSTFDNLNTVEVGVYKGDFTRCILDAINPAMHYMVDAWYNFERSEYKPLEFQEGGPYQKPQSEWDEIYQTIVDTYGGLPNTNIIRMKSVEAAKQFKDESLHFVYIDADHHKLRDDILAWWPKIMPGGIIAGHDFVYNYDFPLTSVRADVESVFGDEYYITNEPNHRKQWFKYKI